MRLNIGNTEALFINYANGNIGIGTTSPTQKLDVAGAGNFSIGLTAPIIQLTAANGTSPMQIGSSTLISNLNADLLDGNHASAFVGIGATGSLPYVNNATNSTLTRSGSGPYTLGLNLANANTWTATQTFANVGIGGSLSLTGTNVGTGTSALMIATNGSITKQL